jgi:hypothetical protein
VTDDNQERRILVIGLIVCRDQERAHISSELSSMLFSGLS